MPNVISYDTKTRDQFDAETRAVLDLILDRFPLVEIECVSPRPNRVTVPEGEPRDQWFVQVYRNGSDDPPEGFFGDTTLQAAARVARALKLELE